MKKTKKWVAALLLLCIGSGLSAQPLPTEERNETYDHRMEWFGKAKLGIFIHWGIYAVRGVSESWSFYNDYLPYEEYMKQQSGFKAEKYKPEEWV